MTTAPQNPQKHSTDLPREAPKSWQEPAREPISTRDRLLRNAALLLSATLMVLLFIGALRQ